MADLTRLTLFPLAALSVVADEGWGPSGAVIASTVTFASRLGPASRQWRRCMMPLSPPASGHTDSARILESTPSDGRAAAASISSQAGRKLGMSVVTIPWM